MGRESKERKGQGMNRMGMRRKIKIKESRGKKKLIEDKRGNEKRKTKTRKKVEWNREGNKTRNEKKYKKIREDTTR